MDKTNQELKLAKYMGGIGSIIMPLQALGLVGIILVFIAIKKISDITVKKEIFSNYLISFVLGALIVFLFTAVYISVFVISSVANADNAQFNPSNLLNRFGIILLISFFVVPYIIIVVSSFFKKKSFVIIGKELEVEAFETAGNLYFLGAILSIILVGFIIMFIAWIYEIIAFFSIKEELSHGSMPPQSA